jgi:hypothetical protein
MELISALYGEGIKQMMRYAKADMTITERNVRQEANKDILPFIDKMLDGLVLPGSLVRGSEHLAELLDKAKTGASCLLLLEHYSNFDLPAFSYLLRKSVPRGQEIADAVIAIAGMKLNEEHPVVAAFTSAYSRIVIYPSRTLEKLDPETARAEIIRSNGINRAAMKALNDAKKEGKLILVFPAGTRFRPWEPETKKGVREIDSYIKSFDYMCLVSINGEVLKIQQGKMTEDKVAQDVIHIESSPVLSCAEFRDSAKSAVPEDADRKQAVVDAIMARLEEMHVRNEKIRKG